MSTRTIRITEKTACGGDSPLLLIAGPCQIESLDHCLKIADYASTIAAEYGLGFVFKSSFDKANRTSLRGKRGLGVEQGLEILQGVKDRLGVALLTDVHTPEQAALAASVVDVLQTPAFLCRQTDFLTAVGETGKVVNIKKGQFLAPEDMQYAAEKVAASGNEKILLCERGTCFGYRDLVLDPRSLVIMRSAGYPVIFDATHSVQSMGGAGASSGGSREYVAPLSRAAIGVGVDGVFIECHDQPERAPSDGPSMLPLEQLKPLISQLAAIHEQVQIGD